MIGSVQILKNNGESLISNGLAHFKFNDTNKQYIIYTLGEQINELLKIYIGYENAPVTDPGISDDDSAKITELLKKIGKNEDVSTLVTILPLSVGLYHVHDKVKKVALQTSAFNNIISTQQRGQIQTLDKDEPIMKENTFFDSSVTKEEAVKTEKVQEESIFANPMQPVMGPSTEQPANDKNYSAAPGSVVGEQLIENKNAESSSIDVANESGQTTTSLSESNVYSQVAATTPESDLIDTRVAEMNYNSDKNIEINGTISDEEAKNAILAVEKAQATIKDNIVIIKEFIKQQKNKVVLKTMEPAVETKSELKEEIREVPAKSSQVEPLPAQYDVVNNLELAPQPKFEENVLSKEPNLESDYLVDTSINQITSEIDTGSAVDASVSIPRVDLSKQIPAEPENDLIQQGSENTAYQIQGETPSQVPLNEQKLPAETSLLIEEQPEMIDTMAMIPPQGAANTGISTMASLDNSKSEILDTRNMVTSGNTAFAPDTAESNLYQSLPQSTSESLNNSEEQKSVGIIPEVKSTEVTTEELESQNGFTSQNMQSDSNSTIDIQIPDVELESSFITPGAGQFVQEQGNNVTTDIPDLSRQANMNMQAQTNSGDVVGGEFAIPQIDMNVPTVDQTQAPVIMPDGQSQDVNQGLVLTPDAFNKAA